MTKEMPLDIGLRVDVLDDEGIWNTGVIVDVGKEENLDKVEIKYDGWDEDYNQWIGVDKQRLAPLHTYTIVKKCWAKLTKWPWWPAFVVLRAPATALAAQGLEEETKLYVEFYDSFNEDKRSRCWMQKKNVASFRDNFEDRASKNIGKNFPKYVEGTQRAKAGTSPLLFSGPGTLPIEYSSKLSEPLEEKKKECSPEQWFHLYRDFSNRYQELYGYSTAPVLTGKRPSSYPGLKSGKRGPGRPSKHATNDEQLEEANGNDEKSEELEVGEAKKSDGVVQVATSGRRNKPAAPEALPSSRKSRPRRVKVIEVLTASMVASSHSPAPCVCVSSPTSSSNARNSNFDLIALSAEAAAKTEVCSDGPEVALEGLTSDTKLVVNLLPSFKEQREVSTEPLCGGLYIEEDKYVEQSVKGSCFCKVEGAGNSCKRKISMTPPAKLSERIKITKTAEMRKVRSQVSEHGPNLNLNRSGRSRCEVDGESWSIHGWFMDGLQSRLLRR
ncbi:hypothetical protein PsorP6_002412 [Peronosclerospora sorghi]|uniref:Uncharacterized protein n=1 Tax=Peronosclerospora sorghi TaxID=230839 RepID=A0ACC0WUZ9_9STRA|nr:hypothetical protein PsorP6_002412 [Peronosclerospora sorghi]